MWNQAQGSARSQRYQLLVNEVYYLLSRVSKSSDFKYENIIHTQKCGVLYHYNDQKPLPI